MRTGFIISGLGHLVLILWLLFGSMLFPPDNPPAMQVADVSLVSSAQLQSLIAQASAPPAKPQTRLTPPRQPAAAADRAQLKLPKPETSPKPVARPTAQPQPKPDKAPKAPKAPEPAPPAKVAAQAPRPLPQPKPDTSRKPVLTPPPPPAPAPRVAPTPAPAPPPDIKTADQLSPDVTANPAAPPAKTKPKEATAPKQAATQIVPKSIKSHSTAPSPSLAPNQSVRPESRPPAPPTPPTPAQPAAPAQPQKPPADKAVAAAKPDTKPKTTPKTPEKKTAATPPKPDTVAKSATDAAVAAAMAALNPPGGSGKTPNAGSQPASRGLGGGLTQAEKDGLRLAVQKCWIVDVGSQAANVTVTVGTQLSPDGRVVPGSIKLISAKGGDSTAIQVAFDAARRAILRCGANGYKLPPQKYDQWRDIEMVFNPDGMRLR